MWEEVLYYDGHKEAIALVYGVIDGRSSTLCRVHSFCLASHGLLSVECDCLDQMMESQKRIVEFGSGLVLLLMQDGRDLGQYVEMLAVDRSKRSGLSQDDSYESLVGVSDARSYRTAALVLKHLNADRVRLLSNNPAKAAGLEECGIVVEELLPIKVSDLANRPELAREYEAKRASGHFL